MKIILSSDGLPAVKGLSRIVDKPINQLNICWIITACRTARDMDYLNIDYKLFHDNGFNVTIYDIAGKNSEQFVEDFKKFDVIWMEGGNTFGLLTQVKKTGFDKFLRKWVETKPYVGVSAGSYIMQPSVILSTLYNPKSEWDYVKDFSALGVVDLYFFVHSQKRDKAKLKSQVDEINIKAEFLNEGEAYLVEDNNIELIEI